MPVTQPNNSDNRWSLFLFKSRLQFLPHRLPEHGVFAQKILVLPEELGDFQSTFQAQALLHGLSLLLVVHRNR